MWQHKLVTTKPCAFFDVDNTLISIKSMFSFFDFLQQNSSLIPDEFMAGVQAKLSRLFADKERRESINEFYYGLFRDVPVVSLAEQGRIWFESVAKHEDFFHPHALARLHQHQAEGYNIVFVSGSGMAMLQPLAEILNVNAILCAPQVQHQGKYTGELYDQPCIGAGKAYYINQFLTQFSDVTASSIAYGDDISDFPMLESVGQGYLVSPDNNTIAANLHKGFAVLKSDLVAA